MLQSMGSQSRTRLSKPTGERIQGLVDASDLIFLRCFPKDDMFKISYPPLRKRQSFSLEVSVLSAKVVSRSKEFLADASQVEAEYGGQHHHIKPELNCWKSNWIWISLMNKSNNAL